VVGYPTWNLESGNRIILLPQQLEGFRQAVEAVPAIGYSLKGMSLAQHTGANAAAGLYDEGYTKGVLDSTQQYITDPNTLIEITAGVAGASAGGRVFRFNATKGGRSVGAMTRREYQAASYHGKVGNAVKSKAPTNGQDALDMSVQVKANSPRRVGIDYQTGEFVVFDQTSSGIFHGHVRGRKDLTNQMQNTLRKSGMVDRKGNILGGGQ